MSTALNPFGLKANPFCEVNNTDKKTDEMFSYELGNNCQKVNEKENLTDCLPKNKTNIQAKPTNRFNRKFEFVA